MVRRVAHSPSSSEVIRKPGQDEEDVDAEEPAADQRGTAVVEHDAEHGDGPEPVEGGHEAEDDRPAPRGRRDGEPSVGRPWRIARAHRVGCLRLARGAPVRQAGSVGAAHDRRSDGSAHRRDLAVGLARRRAAARRASALAGRAGPAARPAQTAGLYPAGRLMVFFSRNSSRPSSPNSRPTPDALYPPNGDEKSIGMFELTM